MQSNWQKAQLDVVRLEAQNTTIERFNAQMRVRIARMAMDGNRAAIGGADAQTRRPLTQQVRAVFSSYP